MSFKRPFKAQSIQPGKVWQQRMAERRRAKRIRTVLLGAGVAFAVFGIGMAATNVPKLSFVTSAFADPPNGAAACRLLSVHDGDTIRCGTERVRLLDIDAPELPGSPKCEGRRSARAWCDFDLGYKSRDELRAFLSTGTVGLIRQGQDKYGRTLARVEVNGQNAGEHLISMGLARTWR